MAYVIQIEWLGDLEVSKPSEHAGRYVSRYDPDAHGGMGQVWTVSDPKEAIQFASHAEIIEFYKQASRVKPVRDDGKPNRPLTAFTVSIYDWKNAMSRGKFDDQCPGCRPAMMDAETGKVLPDDSPQMKCVLSIWAETSREEREAFQRFNCLNSRQDRDLQIVNDLWARMAKALEAIPKEFL